MTEKNQSYLRFSVEESVWFQRGQEVDELVSISLDPDITIEEYDQYITIRGALQLTGEYRINENGSNETEGFTNGRFINEVKTRVDGISELKHRFPVDITIPKNRIQNLDEVYISIDSFDYERQNNNCLQLVADLSISGISDPAHQTESKRFEEIENRNEESGERKETDSSTLFMYEEDEDDVLEVFEDENHPEFSHSDLFDAYHDVDDDLDDSSDEDENQDDSNETDFDDDFEDNDGDLYTPFEVQARKEVYQDYVPGEYAKDDDLYTPTVVEARKEVVQDEQPAAVEVTRIFQNNVNPQIELKGRNEKEDWSYPQQVDKRHEKYKSLKKETNNQETVEQPKEKRDENALYLTNIFAKDENQDFTRLKMYIVQTGDSLNTVSERYDVTVQQILRINRFDQERTIQSGQILYIPVQEKSKSSH